MPKTILAPFKNYPREKLTDLRWRLLRLNEKRLVLPSKWHILTTSYQTKYCVRGDCNNYKTRKHLSAWEKHHHPLDYNIGEVDACNCNSTTLYNIFCFHARAEFAPRVPLHGQNNALLISSFISFILLQVISKEKPTNLLLVVCSLTKKKKK